MSETPEKKDDVTKPEDGEPTVESLTTELDKAKASLAEYEKFEFTADDKKHTVNLLTEEGRVEARRLLAGGKHIHRFNEERKKREAAEAAKRDKSDDNAPADTESPAAKLLAEMENDDDHKVRMEEDSVYAQQHKLLKLVVEKGNRQATAQAGVSAEDVENLMALADIKADPRFREAAERAGVGDIKAGTEIIFRRYNQKVKDHSEQGLSKPDLWADVVDPYNAKYAPKDKKDKTDAPKVENTDPPKPDTENDAEEPPDSGAGAGGGGLPKGKEMPVFKTQKDVDKFLKEDRRARTGTDFDQSEFLP